MEWGLSQLLQQAEVENSNGTLGRTQSESPSKMWKRRAGDRLFLPRSLAVPIDTLPVTVGTCWKPKDSEPCVNSVLSNLIHTPHAL